MFLKKDLDKLLTLVRKWHRAPSSEKRQSYYDQAIQLSKAIAEGTEFDYTEMGVNRLFSFAWRIAERRWPNEQFYLMIERAGGEVEPWEYKGHFI